MADLKISPPFINICSKEFGIRPIHAIDAVKKSDNIEAIKVDGLRLDIHTKYIPIAKPPMYLLVTVTAEADGKKINRIDFAVKIYPDLCDNFQAKTPLDLIESFANRFGTHIQIGNVRTKFILQQKIPIMGKTHLFTVKNPKKRRIFHQFYVKVESGRPRIANCAMCYCLDRDDYISWLKSKGVV